MPLGGPTAPTAGHLTSKGNVRHFLELCHKAFAGTFSGHPSAVPPNRQAEAAGEVAATLLPEVRSFGSLGNDLHSFLLRLGSLFELSQRRTSQSEPERTHFAIKDGEDAINDGAERILREAVKWSVLFEERETKVKTVGSPQVVDYVLNPTYAPYFQISYRKGRKLHLSATDFNILCSGTAMSLIVDGKATERGRLLDLMASANNEPIALETTTLGFVEVLLCAHAALGQTAVLDCLYVEPGDYRCSRDSHLLAKRDFELSGEIVGFRGIPGTARMLSDRRSQRYIFFAGYEGARFRRAFTDLEMLKGHSSNVIFGVPAFQPGWEMDSFANNVPVMRDEQVTSVYFCGADNPRAAVEILCTTYAGLQEGETLFVAPIGTKPHGVATALFSAEHPDVGILYDHPSRTRARSTAVGQWHLFTVSDFG